ncbi:ribonucleoside reductase class II [Mycobacterium phage Phaded]|uniref:Uncharacterized protein n=1 Tax=Mycobacterium phage Phaded TaxID=2686088 RepID=A0A6B9J6U9_9CAUD|nr:ribonucleoside reductase class II [Mycobacterium phage Phaded]QGZ16851.1 hypothetical protein SEA_PHADED_51 [Mycobacterium phage Phaded]
MKGSNLSYEDPFADAPVADEAQQEPTPAATQVAEPAPKPVVAGGPAGDLSVTFKGDGSYASPWIVPKYATVADALVDLGEDPSVVAGMGQAQRWMALFERATKMAAHFAKLSGGAPAPANGGGQQRQQSRAPQAAQEAPNGEERFCSHGKMEFKSGVSKKTGKPYKLFSCTAPRDQQCDAQFLKS